MLTVGPASSLIDLLFAPVSAAAQYDSFCAPSTEQVLSRPRSSSGQQNLFSCPLRSLSLLLAPLGAGSSIKNVGKQDFWV